MAPSRRSQQVHDPRILRAIAHPVRNRILGELTAGGPSRAADLARELDIPANQASFHLRQLAKYGLVEEAPDEARDRRDRVWKVVADEGLSVDVGELEKAPGGKAAVAVFQRNAATWAHRVVDAAYSDTKKKDTLRTITEQAMHLTKAEAEQFAAELDEVLQRWAKATRGRDPERRTYLLLSILQPYPETRPEAADG